MPEKETSIHPWFTERRYFPLIIASAFVIFSISAFFICYRHHVVSTEQVLHEDRTTAKILSLLLDEHLHKIVSVMESYSHRPLLIRAAEEKNAEKAKAHLISLTERNPDISSVIVTDRQGTLWAAYPKRPEVLGKNFSHRDWYQDVSKEWKPYISDAYLRVVAEKDIAVGIGVPVINEKGKAIGILHNTYRAVSISNMIKQLPLDPGARITVADRKGQLIYSTRYNVEKEIRFHPFHADMKKAAAANHKTFAVVDHEFGGKTRYFSFAPVSNIGWTVLVGRYKRSIFMSEIAYFIQVTAIALLLFLSVILFLFYARKQVTAQQILKQLEAEKKIRASRERFKSYIDVTMQLAWTTNDKGEIVEDNPSWSKFTGRGYEAYKGFGWIEDIHPDDRELTGRIWGKAVAEKSFYETEYRVRRYDGVYRDYLARGIPLLDENGSVREWVGTCIDITERKRAEEAQALQARIATAFVTVSTGEMYDEVLKVILNVMQSPFGVFGYLDEAGALLVPTMTRQIWDRCQVPEKMIRFPRDTWGNSSWPQAIREKKANYSNDVSKKVPDGHVTILRHISTPILFQGDVIGLFQVANKKTDYTAADLGTLEAIAGQVAPLLDARLHRERAEEALEKRTQELVRSNRELEQFAYVASHDLQEPLRMVSSYTQLLARRYEGKLDQDAQDFIHYAVDGANRMQRLIQDLLAYSRITTRGSPFVPLDLHEALGEAVANLQTAINESSAMVTNGELPTVSADRTQLVQVFQNLVGNAIKFRNKDVPPRIHVWAERSGIEWIVSVKDNGIGIDPQYFNRLFTIFQRLHGKQEYPGTGIGLAICQRIMMRHGGRIWVESAPGAGATFRFTIKV